MTRASEPETYAIDVAAAAKLISQAEVSIERRGRTAVDIDPLRGDDTGDRVVRPLETEGLVNVGLQ
jgi:hypothetical protein